MEFKVCFSLGLNIFYLIEYNALLSTLNILIGLLSPLVYPMAVCWDQYCFCYLKTTYMNMIFGDDAKIYNNSANVNILLIDLNKLVTWSKLWLLSFNIDKCRVIHYGRNNTNHTVTHILWIIRIF